VEAPVLPSLRRLLIVTLLIGMLGTGAELLLLGHFESAWQLTPLVLLALGLVVTLWQLRAPTALSTRVLQLLMLLFLVGGVVGVGLHYSGNAAFELEMYPSLGGLALVGGSLTGATPVLAPGSMCVLGLVGLSYTLGHPALIGGPAPPLPEEELP
jgi:hypothetical protein